MYSRTIDLHGMTVAEARRAMLALLKSCPASVREIEVIHGSHSGQALLRYVRVELQPPRISRKILGLNNGVTILELK